MEIGRHRVIEDVLDEWAPALGAARIAYGGHAYRVYNIARQLLGSTRQDDELAVTSAFHDLGIWSDRTFDYLAPSVERAHAYVRARMPAVSEALVETSIMNHHALRRVRSEGSGEVVEAFRQADLVDVTRGWFRAGLDRGFLAELVAEFPYAGFHGVLVRTALSWWARHPLRPLPVLRLSPALPPNLE